METLDIPKGREVSSEGELSGSYSREFYVSPVYVDEMVRTTDANRVHIYSDEAIELGKATGVPIKGRVAHGLIGVSTAITSELERRGLEPESLVKMNTTFESPVHPGETIRHDISYDGKNSKIDSYVGKVNVIKTELVFGKRRPYIPSLSECHSLSREILRDPFHFARNLERFFYLVDRHNPFIWLAGSIRVVTDNVERLSELSLGEENSEEGLNRVVSESLPPFDSADEDVLRNVLPGLRALGPSARVMSRVLGKRDGTLWRALNLDYYDPSDVVSDDGGVYSGDMKVRFRNPISKQGRRMKFTTVGVNVMMKRGKYDSSLDGAVVCATGNTVFCN